VKLLVLLLASFSAAVLAQSPAPQPPPSKDAAQKETPPPKPAQKAPPAPVVKAPLAPVVKAPLAPAPTGDPETDAFNAAFELKKKKRNVEAAQAFEEIAQKYPVSPRLSEALVESGVCWYGAAREKMVLHRANEASNELAAKATRIFTAFLGDRSKDPLAGRVQYLVGMNRFFLGDLAGAEAAFDAVMTKFPTDPKYVPLALERRSAMRRHLLETDLALSDLQRYVREYPKGESIDNARKSLEFALMFEKAAPPLRVEAWVQGGPIKLEELKGKVVGLLFFATWCPHCEEERPFILDLERRYAPAGLVMIGVVNHAQKQTVDSVKAWLPKNDVRFPVLMDDNQATDQSYHLSKIPNLVLIDKSGRVRWQDNPAGLWDYTVETLLSEDDHPSATPRTGNPPGPK
jgi:TolA-binding protein/peroxiredoxin